jgi:hypothetical protein
MNRREKLHEILVDLLGSRNVYFQPPSTVKMKYPAIVYSRNRIESKYANDKAYKTRTRYTVIVIDSDPDSLIPEKVATLPLCRHDRRYTTENLNHDAFSVYF